MSIFNIELCSVVFINCHTTIHYCTKVDMKNTVTSNEKYYTTYILSGGKIVIGYDRNILAFGKTVIKKI